MNMKRIKLGEVCEIVSGSTPKTGIDEYWDGDIDWITPAELTDETYIIKESQRKITYAAVQKSGLKSFAQGTVILSSRAPIGKVAIAGKEMYCNQGFKNLICSDQIDNRYLYWYLKGKTDYLNSLGRGATFKEISKTIVEGIEIPLPDIDEQISCSNILKKCWDLILEQKEQIKAYDELIKSRFVEMFGDPFTNPLGWKKKLLGDVCDVRDGTHDSPQYCSEGYPLVTSKNVTSGKIDLSSCNYISKEDFIKINERSKVDIGDIIMPMIGTVGKPVIVNIEPNFAIKNVALIKFNNVTDVDNIYVKTLLESEYFDRSVLSKIRGGTQKFIALGDIRKLEILLPTIDAQQKFRGFIEHIDNIKLIKQKALNETQLLFDSLMQKYFS